MLDLIHTRSATGDGRNGDASEAVRVRRAAWAFTTRRVRGSIRGLVHPSQPPQAGDLVLARVDSIGFHSALQLADGRRKHLFVGDEVVVAYGNRYAPNQFEAVVPKTLGPCQLVAAGGVAGKVLSWHASVTKDATQITPVGLVAGANGLPVNLRHHALPPADRIPTPHPVIIAVAGTAMDSGKTQSAAYLVKGLSLAGLRVGYAKVTGTGSGNDTWFMRDAGAKPVLDFTDAGLVSTYLVSSDEMEQVFVTLLAHLARSQVNTIVLEIADGLLQAETAALLESPAFRDAIGGILFASCDAMGAVAGSAWLRDRNLPVIALGGVLTAAPLQRAEAARSTGLPLYSRPELARPGSAIEILTLAERTRAAATETERPARARPVRERLDLRFAVTGNGADAVLAPAQEARS